MKYTTDLDISNEIKAEGYQKCKSCGSTNIVGCAFNSYMCASCGATWVLTKEEIKAVLGTDYEESDIEE